MKSTARRLPIFALSLMITAGFAGSNAFAASPAKSTLPASNPFSRASSLPYGAEPMGEIKDADFKDALDVGMVQEDTDIAKIVNSKEKPTFENTIVPLDRSGVLLGRVNALMGQLLAANTNDTLDKINDEETPRLQAHQDRILLNAKLFKRVKAVYDARDSLGLNDDQKFLTLTTYRGFVHSGAELPADKKKQLAALNNKIAKLSNDYRVKLLAAGNEAAVLIDSKEELDGLSEGDLAAAAAAAKKGGHEGKYLLVIRNTTQQPLLASLKNRDVRLKLMKASETRGEHPGANDLRDLITTLAQLRAQKAELMGFPNFAAFVESEQMAKNPETAKKLLIDLAPAAVKKAKDEAAEIQAVIDQQKGGFKLTAADWNFYAEQVRKAKYSIDVEEVKQYFEINRVLQDGVFFAANKMYGLTFKERHDIPTYHPDMRVFEVFEESGKPLALFMLDPWARSNKNGGAWCNTLNRPAGWNNTLPIIINTENFTKPEDGKPGLISFDDATTMFHEFGHALHAMFSIHYYQGENGFNVPTDVVEFPSQFNEHWAMEPTVFANYAKHYQTGAAMPQELVDKIKKARTYGKGYGTLEYTAAALLDLEWHSLTAKDPKVTDVDAFEAAALKKDGVAMDEVPPRYRSPYFLHIWGNGYEANYYAYMWGEILDDDSYEWFVENGGMTRQNGQTFRDKMLGRTYTADPMEIYRAFRGRDPSAEAIKRERGLE
jgi:peptidyl-dipeptidase Dcp